MLVTHCNDEKPIFLHVPSPETVRLDPSSLASALAVSFNPFSRTIWHTSFDRRNVVKDLALERTIEHSRQIHESTKHFITAKLIPYNHFLKTLLNTLKPVSIKHIISTILLFIWHARLFIKRQDSMNFSSHFPHVTTRLKQRPRILLSQNFIAPLNFFTFYIVADNH